LILLIELLSGKDQFRRQQYLALIKTNTFENEDLNGFNYQELENPDISEFCAAIQTPAFGAGKKLILIKDFKPLENKSEDKDIERICNSLTGKPSENIIIFNSEKINGALKLVKKIKKDFKPGIKEHKFELFKSWDLKEATEWLCKIYPTLKDGEKLNYEIAEFIAEQVGVEDSAKLYNELERLITTGKALTKKNLEKELDSKHDVFKLIRFITQSQKEKALSEFEKIVKARELNIGLLAILETTISNSLKLKLAEKEFRNKDELAAFMGMTTGRVYYQQKELAKVSIEHLNRCLEKVLHVERQVKTGRDQLERAIIRDLLLN
jgi:DNA polymerase III delta subunit